MNRRKYVPHVPSLHQLCDNNYAMLLRLLPDCDSEDLSYRFSPTPFLEYQIRILESSRYTSLLEVSQLGSALPGYRHPSMQVRLYHDAQMAEVISAEQIAGILPSYRYPNAQMHQPNEKEMLNRFLAEWLTFCSKNLQSCAAQ